MNTNFTYILTIIAHIHNFIDFINFTHKFMNVILAIIAYIHKFINVSYNC